MASEGFTAGRRVDRPPTQPFILFKSSSKYGKSAGAVAFGFGPRLATNATDFQLAARSGIAYQPRHQFPI